MDLEPELVLSPSLFIAGLQRGSQFDVSRVRSSLRAALPAITFTRLSDDCAPRPTYRLTADQTGASKYPSTRTQTRTQAALLRSIVDVSSPQTLRRGSPSRLHAVLWQARAGDQDRQPAGGAAVREQRQEGLDTESPAVRAAILESVRHPHPTPGTLPPPHRLVGARRGSVSEMLLSLLSSDTCKGAHVYNTTLSRSESSRSCCCID